MKVLIFDRTSRLRIDYIFIASLICLIGSTSIAFCLGPVPLSLPTVVQALFTSHNQLVSANTATIIWQVRAPRIFLAILVGAALAGAGSAFQSLLRNDLAEPYVLGISSGASVASVLVGLSALSSPALFFLQPVAAFAGAGIVLFFVIGVSYKFGRIDTRSLLLGGVVMSAFLWAVEMGALRIVGKSNEEILNYLMGSLSAAQWSEVLLLGVVVFIGFGVLFAVSPSMNLFAVGEESAQQLGLNAEGFKWTLIITSTILAATTVAFVGIVGFIGLIAPHIARKLLKTPDHRFTVPLAGICGAVLMLWSDTLARVLLSGDILPVGIITAFLGAPFFCYKLKTE